MKRRAAIYQPDKRRLWAAAKQLPVYGALLFFSYLMLLITLQYVPVRTDAAFLQIKQEALQHWFYPAVFFTHVFSSIVVLLAGVTQFPVVFRTRYRKVHRYAGRVYVLLILCVSGPTGFVMACLANGGWVAQVAFCLLAALWVYVTWKGYATIRQGNVAAHQRWMARSYALTLSAVTLRLWKWGIVLAFEPRPMDTYRMVAWLGWTVNLAAAELILNGSLKRVTRRWKKRVAGRG